MGRWVKSGVRLTWRRRGGVVEEGRGAPVDEDKGDGALARERVGPRQVRDDRAGRVEEHLLRRARGRARRSRGRDAFGILSAAAAAAEGPSAPGSSPGNCGTGGGGGASEDERPSGEPRPWRCAAAQGEGRRTGLRW